MRVMVFDRYVDSRNIERAGIAAAAQIALIVFGWGVAQYPTGTDHRE
jgi:hypothetical protein